MNWFFKWMYNGLKSVENGQREEEIYATVRPKKSSLFIKASTDTNNVNLSASPQVFRLYTATGGHIVEYSYYDEKTDRNVQALHLIPSDADLGESLSKIMTLEALKR